MKQKITLLLLILSLGSCATIFNKKNHTLSIASNATDARLKINDSIYKLPAMVIVKRSKNDLPIELISDSLTKKYTLKPSVNAKFLYGNLLFLEFCPIGYITDFTNQKRFSYQDSIYLDIHDSISVVKTDRAKRFEYLKHYFTKEYPTKKGQINIVAAIPYVNNFYMEPTGESSVISTGFFGFSAGAEYFYTNKNYFEANFRTVIDYEYPIPMPYESVGEYGNPISSVSLRSVSLHLTHNHKLNRFSVGYGLNYTKNRWYQYTAYDENTIQDENENNGESIAKTNKALGITMNGYYQVSPFFYIGLNFNQSLLNLKDYSDSQFEHVLSLDLVFKFSTNKNKLP